MKKLLCFCLLFFTFSAWAASDNITARSFLLADNSGQILLEKNSHQVQPIASITKLMTVLVVLKAHQDTGELLPLDFRYSQRFHTRLPRNLRHLSRGELIQLALVKSDNFAAWTLCDNYPGGVAACVTQMNIQARLLDMTATEFTDPTGLDTGNVSNAQDLVHLVLAARKFPEITQASGLDRVSISGKTGQYREFFNTNPLVRSGIPVLISKTGFINSSGGCLVMLAYTAQGLRVVVLLGSKNTRTRIPEAQKIIAQL